MTKGEVRKARQQAREEGRPLTDELTLERHEASRVVFSDTVKGRRALDRYARRAYDTTGPIDSDDY